MKVGVQCELRTSPSMSMQRTYYPILAGIERANNESVPITQTKLFEYMHVQSIKTRYKVESCVVMGYLQGGSYVRTYRLFKQAVPM